MEKPALCAALQNPLGLGALQSLLAQTNILMLHLLNKFNLIKLHYKLLFHKSVSLSDRPGN